MRSSEDLEAIVEQIWSAYLTVDGHGPLTVTGEDPPPDQAMVTASVTLDGAFTGHLAVAVSVAAAAHVTSLMLDLEPSGVHDDDIVDAVGELAGIIAGNVKALMPQPTMLGLPIVYHDAGAEVAPAWRPADATSTHELYASWDGEPIRVSVLASTH